MCKYSGAQVQQWQIGLVHAVGHWTRGLVLANCHDAPQWQGSGCYCSLQVVDYLCVDYLCACFWPTMSSAAAARLFDGAYCVSLHYSWHLLLLFCALLVAQVTVTTTTGSKLSNVLVTVTWGSVASSTVFPYSTSGTTTSQGQVSFTSKTYPSTSPGGCTFTVVSAQRAGYALDPNTSLIGPTATW